MFGGFVDAVLGFVSHYGYVAVFVYLVLETAFILHFVPSEIVVPFAAAELVHDPFSFALFVAVTTAGATLGSLLAFGLFGRYGRAGLEEYGHVVHVSERNLDRSQDLFQRYGESSVLWGRLLPFLRALISIPAGLAEMELRKFTLYSATGAAIFNTGLTYLVYTGKGQETPLQFVLGVAHGVLGDEFVYLQTHAQFVLVLLGLACLVFATAWLSRDWIRRNPGLAKTVVLQGVRAVGVFVGLVLLAGALTAPEQAFERVTWAWDDPGALLSLGLTRQAALGLTGVASILAGVACYEAGVLVDAELLAAVVARVRRDDSG